MKPFILRHAAEIVTSLGIALCIATGAMMWWR